MAHHNHQDCDTWPCNPAPSQGHHPPPDPPEPDGANDGTTSDARSPVQPPKTKDT